MLLIVSPLSLSLLASVSRSSSWRSCSCICDIFCRICMGSESYSVSLMGILLGGKGYCPKMCVSLKQMK